MAAVFAMPVTGAGPSLCMEALMFRLPCLRASLWPCMRLLVGVQPLPDRGMWVNSRARTLGPSMVPLHVTPLLAVPHTLWPCPCCTPSAHSLHSMAWPHRPTAWMLADKRAMPARQNQACHSDALGLPERLVVSRNRVPWKASADALVVPL
jgi:hypothetical protein